VGLVFRKSQRSRACASDTGRQVADIPDFDQTEFTALFITRCILKGVSDIVSSLS